ncbi:MAG: 50S ribosomal protein L13 [Deltaproteobacteria bacterium]|nr:50S ribosomal protein L13 [Deltaproteobacteria bacterium]MBM4391802.1 50S ribosomal protein L13 [Deltaproteobacteria bacterium]
MHDHHTWTTHSTNAAEATHDWFVVDAAGQTLGRLATRISTVLQGKHKPSYTPHTDCGDFVIVLNADKIVLTGKKLDQKKYHHYSGYPGGLSSVTARVQLDQHPERVIAAAVQGMVPRNRLGRQMLTKLKVYAAGEHPHAAQQPKPFPEYV